jgi:hypothetical protein
MCLKTAWQQSARSIAWWSQEYTARELEAINQAVVAFVQASNTCPETFEQLRLTANNVSDLEYYWSSGKFVDGWGHPFAFSSEGTNCLIVSYGRDGKPGGKGVDFDLTSQHPMPKEAMPTFEQFFHNGRIHDMIAWCFICGALAAVLSMFTVRVPDFSPRGLVILGLSLGATVIGTLIVAGVITALHIPSGH